MVWPMGEREGTATWFYKMPGRPPLRFDPLPEGKRQRKFTKEEKRAVVDYALEMREIQSAGECAKEVGVSASTLSTWIRAECATYRVFSSLDLDGRTLWTIDYRALLVDLREGKTSICISDYTDTDKHSKRFSVSELNCNRVDTTASAIGEGEGTVWPANDYGGTAVWHYKLPGEPPLWFRPLSKEHGHRDYTETERCAIIDYVLEVRKTKGITTCAKEIGIGRASVSRWLKSGCEAYPIFSSLHLDAHTLRAIDYRELLADLRSGIGSVTISDYTGGLKFSSRKSTRGIRMKNVPAQEEVRNGHPYFVSPGEGQRRVFTEEQKARVVDYWSDEFDGKSASECARECNLLANTLIDWVFERDSKQACSGTAGLSESPPEGTASGPRSKVPLPDIAKRKTYAGEGFGTATWLPKVPGEPPLRFEPLPIGGRHRFTERERNAIIDYVLEVRKTKFIKECAEEMGLNTATISYHVRTECKTDEAFLHLELNDQDLWGVDYRELLADLRDGKSSIDIADYNEDRLPGTERMSVQAKECTRDGLPCFASAGEGEGRVFTEEQRKRIASYRSHEFMEGSVSGDSRERNLGMPTLSDWFDDTYGCASKRCCPDTTGLPGSSFEETASDSDEAPLPGITWEEAVELCP